MANFCHGAIWNSSLIWDTDNPNLTPCLRDAIVLGVPAGLLWLTLPFWYFWVKGYEPKFKAVTRHGKTQATLKDRLTKLFVAKTCLNILVIFTAAAELTLRLSIIEDIAPSDVFYPVCLVATSMAAMVIMFVEKINCIRSSPLLSIFWPLLVIALLPNFKIEIESLLDSFGR